ncbi:hypothetical protein A2159_01460 [Candidatus Woesebacteria bacterium RBG_13_34_9]|uniref:Glycosyltransferase RgtA/B/C/D-like domain-containing protein n=1 Tax=Candidatus Woesebacteria bacterium RBG_13_34_9 TaxID=1802477 RepID=A0A1F7X062_9BACT|nr:MAG: hypothetical protein A2159_01460 [Candidatus Woesebacteria bacterium RBG_13_34_9]
MDRLKVIVKISLLIFLYYLTYYIYQGVINPIPGLGDSWDYHIPISQTILNGSFLHLTDVKLPQWYYPGSSEAINSIFIFFHIPLTLSNVLAVLILLLSLYKLGKVFGLGKLYSFLFSLTFVTLNVILRWINSVNVDIWMAVFFVWALILLENPRKELTYFLKLGFVAGVIIGSKYSGLYIIVVLSLFYTKKIISAVNTKGIIAFIIPFSIFGLFWYVRNYLITGNPFYPTPIFNFPGIEIFNGLRVYSVTLERPLDIFNALFSEYKMWMFVVLIALIMVFRRIIIYKKFKLDQMYMLYLLGLVNFIIYFNFPSDYPKSVMVSSLRYSYTSFIPLILAVFLQMKKLKKEELLGYFSIGNMIMVMSLNYHPKLVLIYLPLALIFFRFLDNINKKKNPGV